MSILTIDNVSKSYFGRSVLDRLSLQLDRGDRLALIGQNGAGKTTLLRLIMNLEKPDQGKLILASQIIPGYLSQQFSENEKSDDTPLFNPELAAMEARLRQLELSMEQPAAMEDSAEHRRIMSQYSQLTAQFEAAGGYEFTHKMKDMAQGLGLPLESLQRPLRTLSGGERMRVALARILLGSPDLLLLDEPTNHLDLAAMEWLETYLSRFKGAVLFVTHDRAFMDRIATSVAELSQGQLTLRPGNYSQFIELKAAEQDTLQRELKNRQRELVRQQDVKQTMLSHRNISGYHAREKVVDKLSSELTGIREKALRLGHKQKLNFRMVSTSERHPADRALLSAQELMVSFSEEPLFTAEKIVVCGGEKVGLCGPNGCGKTTLLAVFLGQAAAAEGWIELDSRTVFGHLGQHVAFTDEQHTVLQTLTASSDLSDGQARNLLAQYGFRETDVFKKTEVLSGGERSRLYLCRLLLEQPDLLFLDEPTNHLDIESREILEQALCEYDGAVFAVSHDRYFIDKCCQRIYGFVQKRVLPFDNYGAYRKAAINPAGQSLGSGTESGKSDSAVISGVKPSSASPSESAEAVNAAVAEAKNPAESRRAVALRKQELRQTEQLITRFEQEKTLLEDKFGPGSNPDDYDRYAAVLSQLEQLYEAYVELADDTT